MKEPLIYACVDAAWQKYVDTYTRPSFDKSVNFLQEKIREIIAQNENFSQKIKDSVK